jgi:hypothetical protein
LAAQHGCALGAQGVWGHARAHTRAVVGRSLRDRTRRDHADAARQADGRRRRAAWLRARHGPRGRRLRGWSLPMPRR